MPTETLRFTDSAGKTWEYYWATTYRGGEMITIRKRRPIARRLATLAVGPAQD